MESRQLPGGLGRQPFHSDINTTVFVFWRDEDTGIGPEEVRWGGKGSSEIGMVNSAENLRMQCSRKWGNGSSGGRINRVHRTEKV